MNRFLIILLALVLLVPVMAQEDAASVAFERLVPSNVRLRLNEETGTAELIFLAVPPVCEPLVSEVTVEGNVIDVDAYVPLSAEGATCNFIAPYEPVIELGELEADISYVIFLNNFASTFFLPQVGGVIMDMPFSVVWGQENILIPFTRVDSIVETVEVVRENDTVSLNISGSHPDACESEAYSWLRADDVNPKLYHIEIFRLIPEGVMCPDALQEFAMTFDTGLSLDETVYLEAGEQYFEYTPEAITAFLYIPVEVESMSIVADGSAYFATVNGFVPACTDEFLQGMVTKDYASFVSVGLIVPLDMECDFAATETFSAEYELSALPLVFNGLAYDETGVITSEASAAGGREPSTGGNVMQVDTVIEAVDVQILESFPMQLNLVVSGYQPDGCDFPVIVEQSVDGNRVDVHIYREVPSDVMCTMMIVTYQETIHVDGSFEGGTVEIHVNDFTASVDL